MQTTDLQPTPAQLPMAQMAPPTAVTVDSIKRVYISGPITGHAGGNAAAFATAEQSLRELGLEPVNPHKNGQPGNAPWAQHMRADIKLMMDCDAVLLLPGWDRSRGARIEMKLAYTLGMPTATTHELAIGEAWHPLDTIGGVQ